MFEILNAIRDFFASLFTGNFKDARKRRELKKVWHELNSGNTRYFKPHTNEVLASFAEAVYKFATYVRWLSDLFDKTIYNPNTNLAEKYKDYLIEAKLDEENRLKKYHFSYTAMKVRLFAASSFKDELLALAKEFDAYLELFRQPEYERFDREFTQIERLASSSRHDYEKLLTFFDPEIHGAAKGYKPNFASAIGRHITQDLMDLYYLLAGLDLGEGVTENVIHLYTRLRKTADNQDVAKIRKIVSMLASLHEMYLSGETLLALLQAANEDPALSIPIDQDVHTYLEFYKSKLLSRFELDREKIIREHSEKAVTHDVNDLFGETKLLEIRGYAENISAELSDEGFASFTHIRAFQIVKSFIILFFEKKIKEYIKQLVIDAFFENKVFKDKFITLFHETQSAVEKITALENSLCEKGDVSAVTVKEYLEKHRKGKSVSASLSKLVDTINDSVVRLVEEITNTMSAFEAALGELLSDYKQHTPTIISNIRVIGGERNQELFRHLAGGHDQMVKFIGIMKNFTIIKKSLQKREEGRTPP